MIKTKDMIIIKTMNKWKAREEWFSFFSPIFKIIYTVNKRCKYIVLEVNLNNNTCLIDDWTILLLL